MTEQERIWLETKELDNLIESGIKFTLPKRSLLRFFGKPERTFLIKQPYLRTLDRLSREWLQIEVSMDRLRDDFWVEGKQIAAKNALRCAKVVAIACLNSEYKISLFGPLLAYYFSCRITPKKLLQLSMLVNNVSNLGDFINSTRLMSANTTTTTPARVEQQPEVMD